MMAPFQIDYETALAASVPMKLSWTPEARAGEPACQAVVADYLRPVHPRQAQEVEPMRQSIHDRALPFCFRRGCGFRPSHG